MAYVLVRPAEPVAERRVRELTAALVADALVTGSCARCGQLVDGSWRRCPTCTTWLAEPCADCGRWSDAELDACPWCGATERVEPTVDDEPAFETGPFTSPPEPRVPALLPGLASLQLAGSAPADVQSAGAPERSGAAPERRPRPARLWGRRPQAPSRARAPERNRIGGGQGARPRS
jgi:RNA polymerase subunit RPABC4/transcription elongation factor Spt4